MDIIHRAVFHLKHDVSETGLCLHLQVEPTQIDPIERANLCFREGRWIMFKILIVISCEGLNEYIRM
jgi:hypothetical protein